MKRPYHAVGICEANFTIFAERLSELGKYGKKKDAIHQIQRCIDERNRYRQDTDHALAVRNLEQLKSTLQTLPGTRFFVIYTNRQDGFSAMPMMGGRSRKHRATSRRSRTRSNQNK